MTHTRTGPSPADAAAAKETQMFDEVKHDEWNEIEARLEEEDEEGRDGQRGPERQSPSESPAPEPTQDFQVDRDERAQEEGDGRVDPPETGPHRRHHVHIAEAHGLAPKRQGSHNSNRPDHAAAHEIAEQDATEHVEPEGRIDRGQDAQRRLIERPGPREALGDQVITGPTLTNVNDFRAILIP